MKKMLLKMLLTGMICTYSLCANAYVTNCSIKKIEINKAPLAVTCSDGQIFKLAADTTNNVNKQANYRRFVSLFAKAFQHNKIVQVHHAGEGIIQKAYVYFYKRPSVQPPELAKNSTQCVPTMIAVGASQVVLQCVEAAKYYITNTNIAQSRDITIPWPKVITAKPEYECGHLISGWCNKYDDHSNRVCAPQDKLFQYTLSRDEAAFDSLMAAIYARGTIIIDLGIIKGPNTLLAKNVTVK